MGYDDHRDAAMTRLQLMRRAGVALLTVNMVPLAVAGCGGDDGESATAGAAEGAGHATGDLSFFSWEGYDLKGSKAMTRWLDQQGIRLQSQYMSNHDQIQAKLRGGNASIDLIGYYDGYAEIYPRLGILQEIDEAKVPNLASCYPLFREGPVFEEFWGYDGKRWGVPFTWGSAPCNYRADRIDAPTSWHDVFKPEFKGKVGTADDVGAFLLAGKLVGHEPPNYTRAQFDEIVEFMRKVLAQVPSVAPGYGDLTNQLVSGEVLLTFSGWGAMDIAAAAQGADVKSTLPEEGSFSFVDAYGIPTTARNPEAALAFINQALTPQVQAQQAELLSAGVVVPEAVPLTTKPTRDLYPYEDIESVFERAPLYPYPPLESGGEDVVTYPEWLDAWARLKAGE